jgi:hypothetical protein
MPALPSVPQVLRTTAKYIIAGAVNAFISDHFKYTGTAPTNTDLGTIANNMAAYYASTLVGDLTADKNLVEIDVVDLTSPTSAQGNWTGTHVGTRTGPPLDAATCLVMSKQIGRRYRGGHPRGYWPLGAAGDLTNPTEWSSGFITSADTWYSDWNSQWVSQTWAGGSIVGPCNVSYYEGFTNVMYPSGRYHVKPTLRATPLVDMVVSFGANPRPGSQRRREGGV